jgi:CheY-like chemotaxis protein/RNA polymerase subunit RPABC4/transcription elongation factor Spt4
MVPLREDAIAKIKAGVTSPDEVLRVVQVDENEVPCPGCKALIEADFATCPYCGKNLKANCRSCGQALRLEWALCPYCNTPTTAEPQAGTQQPVKVEVAVSMPESIVVGAQPPAAAAPAVAAPAALAPAAVAVQRTVLAVPHTAAPAPRPVPAAPADVETAPEPVTRIDIASDLAAEPHPEPAFQEDAVPVLGSRFFEEPIVVTRPAPPPALPAEPKPVVLEQAPAFVTPAPEPELALFAETSCVIEHTSLAERALVFESMPTVEHRAAMSSAQPAAAESNVEPVLAAVPAPETAPTPMPAVTVEPVGTAVPLAREEPPAAAASADPEAGRRPLRALVVDDDADIRMIVTATLRKMTVPMEVVQARDGVEAIEKAREAPPDLAILDVMMPRMDGFDTCRALRADVRTAFVPILMLTASADQDSRTKGYLIGTDDYMAKPFLPVDLKLRIARLLRRTYGI